MGEPMDRSNRIFAPLTSSFDDAYPTLEDATIRYTEFDFGSEETKGIISFRRQGGLLRCGNPRCFRGGYELDWEVNRMIREGVLEKTVTISCSGDEGTPKQKRGDSCDRSIIATIELKLKPLAQ
jgi:hypothetical protein